ncbi:hypothetical protein AV540_15695 [Brevibacillus parabrevis]|nr:hypothetical protein AV540_15695 [Brevibacillus parabrevis]
MPTLLEKHVHLDKTLLSKEWRAVIPAANVIERCKSQCPSPSHRFGTSWATSRSGERRSGRPGKRSCSVWPCSSERIDSEQVGYSRDTCKNGS